MHSLNSNELSILTGDVDKVEVKRDILLGVGDGLDLGWIVISHLEEGRGVWKSSLGLFGGIVSELLGFLGIDDSKFAISSLLVNVGSGSSGSGNKSWNWWDWWEWNSSTLPSNWIVKLEKGRGVWESSLGLIGGLISELLGFLGIDDSKFAISTLLVKIGSSSSGGGDKSWNWWDWWESNSSTLPGNWVLHLEEGRGIWKSSLGLLGSFISELFGLLSINDR